MQKTRLGFSTRTITNIIFFIRKTVTNIIFFQNDNFIIKSQLDHN